ncbi:Serine/threonine protein kinase, partial [Spiromyces aspiralis]
GNDALIRRLFLQLADAIRHCHNHGVYHRDLKPENILLTAASRDVKLIDFGLATYKPVCRDMGCGSAYYMSPECQRGIDGNVSHYAAGPSDVWSLGIILINLTTGRNPWNRAVRGDPLFDRFLQSPDYLLKAVRATPQFRHILLRVLDLNPG